MEDGITTKKSFGDKLTNVYKRLKLGKLQALFVVCCSNVALAFKKEQSELPVPPIPPSPTDLNLLIFKLKSWQKVNKRKYRHITGVSNPHIKVRVRCKNCNKTISYDIHTVMPEPGFFKKVPKDSCIAKDGRKSEITIFCKREYPLQDHYQKHQNIQ